MYKKLQKIIIIQTPKTHRFTIGQKHSHYSMKISKIPNSKIPKLKVPKSIYPFY
jgi:hypothetical protein